MNNRDILKELLEKKGAKNVKASKKHRKIKGIKKNFSRKKGGSKEVIVKVLNGGKSKGHGHNKNSLSSCLDYIEKGSIDNVLKDNEGNEWTKEDLKQLVNIHSLDFKESSYNAKKKNRLFTHFSFSIPPDISNYCNHSRGKLYSIIEIATVNTINKKYPDYNFIYATHDNTADDKNKNIHVHVVVMCKPNHKETGKLKSNKEDIQELREIFYKELAEYKVKLKATPFKDNFKDQRKKQKTLYQFKTINALENKCPMWTLRKNSIKSIMLQNYKNTNFIALLDKFEDLQAKFATVFYNPKDKAFEKFLLLYQENSQMAYWIINKNPKLFGSVTSNALKLENFKDDLDNVDISKFKVSFEYTKEINKPYKYKISETFKEKTPFWFANKENIENVFIKNNNNPNFELLNKEFNLMRSKFNNVFIVKEHNAFAKFLLMYQESPKTAHWVINNNPKTYGHITSNKSELESLQKAIVNWPLNNFNICFEYVKYIQTEYNYKVGEIFEEKTPIWFANKNNIENITLIKDNNDASNFEVLTKEFIALKAKFDDIFVNQDHQAFEKFLLMYQENPKTAYWSIKSNPKVYGFVTIDSKELQNFQTDIEKIDFSKFKVTFNFIKKIKIEYPYAIKKSFEYNCPMWLKNNKHIAKVTIKNKDTLKLFKDIKAKFNDVFIKQDNKALEKFLLMYQENYKTAMLMLKEQPQVYGSLTKDQTKIENLQKEIETLPISNLQINFKFKKQAQLNYQSYIDKDFIEKTPFWFANKDNIKKVSISSAENGVIKDIKLKFNNIFIIKEHNAFEKFLLMHQENPEMAYKAIKNTPKIYGLITTDDNKLKQFQEEITKLPMNKLEVIFKFIKEIEVKKKENLNNKEDDFEASKSKVSDKFKEKSPIWFANKENISSVTLDKNKNPTNDFNALTKEFITLKAKFDDIFTNKENKAFEKFLLMHQEKPTLAKWIIKNNPTMYGLVTLDKYKLTSFQNNIDNISLDNWNLTFNLIKDIKIDYTPKVSDKFKEKSPIWFANKENISSVTLDKNKNPTNDFNVLTKEFTDLKAKFDDIFTNKENKAFEKFLLMHQEKPTLAKWIIKNNPTMYGLVTLDKYKLTSFQNNIDNISLDNWNLTFNLIKDIKIDYTPKISDKFKEKSPIWFANKENISSVTLDKNKNPTNDFNALTKDFIALKAKFDDIFTNKENKAFEKFLLMHQEKPTLAKWIIKNNPTMYGLVTLDKYKLTSFQNNIDNINFKNFDLKFNFIRDINIQKEKSNYI